MKEEGLIKVEGWYDTPVVQHCHIENFICTAKMENGRLTVVSSTQMRWQKLSVWTRLNFVVKI